jgi:cell division protein FtsQ
MAKIDYNRPNTRARVAARRKARRLRLNTAALFPRLRGPNVVQRLAERMRRQEGLRLPMPRRPAVGAAEGSQVRPRARRVALAWLGSGRLVSLLLACASLVALYQIFTSPQFVVRDLELYGATMLSKERVAQLAAVAGERVWFVDTAAVAERLRADPFVEHVSVGLELPDRLLVAVVERQPDLRWQLGGMQYLVDSQGTVLAAAGEPDPQALVLVENGGARELRPGDRVDPDALMLARQLALRLPTDLQLNPALIGWDIALGVYVLSPSGQTIVFGQSEHLERKLAILQYLQADGTQYSFLDLRPETPYYRNNGVAPAPQPEPPAEPAEPVAETGG